MEINLVVDVKKAVESTEKAEIYLQELHAITINLW